MLTGTISFTGRTLSDVRLAIEEALARIDNEFWSGHDSNEDGSFTFEIEGEESPRKEDQHDERE